MGTARCLNLDNKSVVEAYATGFNKRKWDSSSSSSESAVVGLDSPANIIHTPRQHIHEKSVPTFSNEENTSNNNMSQLLTPSANSLFAEQFPSKYLMH